MTAINRTTNNKLATFKNSFDAIATWIIGLSFLIAGFPHWANSYYFLGSIYAYKLVEPGIGQIMAMSMPIIQLVLALCFLTRTFLDASHLATLFLLVSFATVQTSAWVRGLDISCGCFGPGHDSTIGWFSLSLVYSLLALSVIRNAMFLFSRPAEPCDALCTKNSNRVVE
jgi:hypothetical protein